MTLLASAKISGKKTTNSVFRTKYGSSVVLRNISNAITRNAHVTVQKEHDLNLVRNENLKHSKDQVHAKLYEGGQQNDSRAKFQQNQHIHSTSVTI